MDQIQMKQLTDQLNQALATGMPQVDAILELYAAEHGIPKATLDALYIELYGVLLATVIESLATGLVKRTPPEGGLQGAP